MKQKLMAAALVAACLFLTGCSWSLAYTENKVERGVMYCYGRRSSYAFACVCQIEDEAQLRGDITFSVADTCAGQKVLALGGYTGRGYPRPFSVWFPQTVGGYEIFYGSDSVPASYTGTVITVPVTVELGKNIRYLKNVRQDAEYFVYGENETVKAVYKPQISYTFREENAYFYAEDGVLYNKKTHRPALEQ